MRSIGLVICVLALGCSPITNGQSDAGDSDAEVGVIDASVAIDSQSQVDASTPTPPSLAEQQLAFVSDRSGGNRNIWLVRLDGSGLTKVTSGSSDDLFGSITPDGNLVTFARSSDIWSSNVDGTGLTQLTTDAALDTRPMLSRDGTKVVFTSTRDGGNNIYIMNVDGSGQTPVTTGSDSKTFGAFNHDGTKICYANFDDNNSYVINTDGTGNMSLFSSASSESACAFSRDGSKVVFSSDRSGSWELYVGNSDGTGSPQMVTTTGNKDPFHASFDYNGTHLVYYANPLTGNNRAVYLTPIAGGATTELVSPTNSDQKIGSWVILAP